MTNSWGQTFDYQTLVDYTSRIPFMQVTQFRASGHCQLNYGFGLRGLPSFQQMQAFLSGHLKLSDAVAKGSGSVSYVNF